jgi:hypothetical protein
VLHFDQRRRRAQQFLPLTLRTSQQANPHCHADADQRGLQGGEEFACRGLGSADDQHWNIRMGQDLKCFTTQQQSLQAMFAMGRHDDELDIRFFCRPQDRF